MTKKDDTKIVEATEEVSQGRTRPQRRKTYQPVRDTQVDVGLVEHFAKQGYDLKLIRWAVHGEEDYRYLARRVKEGYEFVHKSEIPAEYKASLMDVDARTFNGMVTMGDVCLMKIDQDLRESRRQHYQNVTDTEIESVDLHVIGRKKGFLTQGTRTKVSMREPSFQD